MSEITPSHSPEMVPSAQNTPEVPAEAVNWTKIIYFLYLGGLVIGLTALVGVVMAYIKRKEVPDTWLESHLSFQISTFWYGLVYMLIGVVTAPFLIGWLVFLWWMIWLIVRCVRGLNKLDKQEPISGGFFSLGE